MEIRFPFRISPNLNDRGQGKRMSIDLFSGAWDFDPGASELKSPPSRWRQIIESQDTRIRVREEISRETGDLIVEVDAALDGEFYPVKGSPLVDEISYRLEGQSIHAIGRKQGVVVLRETVGLSASDMLQLSMWVSMGGKEIPLEHFSCCWVVRKGSSAAFSLRKTPINAEALLYTYRRNALGHACFRRKE